VSVESYDRDDPRLYLAAERTFLSWMRTGIALMGFGFVVARFGLFLREFAAATSAPMPPSHGVSLEVGIALILAGAAVIAHSAVRLRRYVASLQKGEFIATFDTRFPMLAAAGLSVLAVVTVAYLWSL
jgi:putative membrane protein